MGREIPFRIRKKIRRILIALCASTIVLYFLIGAPWMKWAFIAVLAVYTVFHAVLWRCPHCGTPIGSMRVSNTCYRCRADFED